MTDNVYLNADRTEVVDRFASGKKWQVSRKEAVRLGLLKDEAKPVQQRRAPQDAEDTATTSSTTAPRADRQRRRSTKK